MQIINLSSNLAINTSFKPRRTYHSSFQSVSVHLPQFALTVVPLGVALVQTVSSRKQGHKQ